MYDDIGRKIQTLSKVLGILSAIGWFVIAIMNDWGVLLGIVLAVVIFLYSSNSGREAQRKTGDV